MNLAKLVLAFSSTVLATVSYAFNPNVHPAPSKAQWYTLLGCIAKYFVTKMIGQSAQLQHHSALLQHTHFESFLPVSLVMFLHLRHLKQSSLFLLPRTLSSLAMILSVKLSASCFVSKSSQYFLSPQICVQFPINFDIPKNSRI